MTDVPAAPRASSRFTREITAAILSPLTIWIIGWAPNPIFDLTIAIIGTLALYEFLVLGKRKGYTIPIAICIAAMLFIVAAFILEPISVEMGVFLALLLIPAAYVFSNGALEDALPSSGIAVLATLYVGMLGGSLVRLHNDFPEGHKLIFFLLLVVWLGDSGAYYFGRTFGRHKLSPRISPKKTVEGLAGGIFPSVVTPVIIHLTVFPHFPPPAAINPRHIPPTPGAIRAPAGTTVQ